MICVIIPISKGSYDYGFSAPLQWLLTPLLKDYNVEAIFSDNPSIDKYIEKTDFFIIELNWFMQLYEFIEIVKYIRKKTNRPILFGGLFSNQFYKKIFKMCEVDFFIRGDVERSIKPLIDNYFKKKSLNNIYNLVTQYSENKNLWSFSEDDFYNIKYSLEWFPEYKNKLNINEFKYQDAKNYSLPMFITTKTGCSCLKKADAACIACLGTTNFSKTYYNRNIVRMRAKHLNYIYENYENIHEYNNISIYDISSDFDYENLNYIDKNVNIEVDGSLSLEKLSTFEKKFKKINYIFVGSGDHINSKSNFDEKEVREVLEYSSDKYFKDNIIFYHHHDHNNDETEIEKKYKSNFYHSKIWSIAYLDENGFSSYVKYDDFFTEENFDYIYHSSKMNFKYYKTRDRLKWIQ